MGKQHMTLYPQLGRKLKSRRSVLTVASTLSVLLTACGGGGGNSSPTVTVPTPPPVVTDSTAPVITLLGFDNVEVVVDGLYFDPGATASDNQDGDISHQITLASAVNTAIAGTYEVSYNVVDAAEMQPLRSNAPSMSSRRRISNNMVRMAMSILKAD